MQFGAIKKLTTNIYPLIDKLITECLKYFNSSE